MTRENLKCAKCGGAMELGFVLDHGDYDLKSVAQWVEGPPQRSFWRGLETSERAVLEVHAYRCKTCGYLESYA